MPMRLSWNEIRARAAGFAADWKDARYEKGETQSFYNDFFKVFGIERRRVATFEEPVKKLGGKQGYIDLFWKGMLLVEQKSAGRNLNPAKEQALDYFPGLKEEELPRFVLLSDFQTFELYDLDTGKETRFPLTLLSQKVESFAFMIGAEKQFYEDQDPVNIRAAERMGEVHDALLASGYSGHNLEMMLVRLLFCLFADDTGIFERNQFQAYIESHTTEDGSNLGSQLSHLFQVLDTPRSKRSANLDEELADFAYINGDLFTDTLPIAAFNKIIRDKLLKACGFNWSQISPAVFGALFQHVMDTEDKEKRRGVGAHYTSEANILKIIRSLFLDDLYAEFERVKHRKPGLKKLHDKLAELRLLDPACGCGNFLILAYQELRRLEMKILLELYTDKKGRRQTELEVGELSRIDVDAFYGIEIEEFPSRVAEVALWLTDHLMNRELSDAFGQYYARIPLKTSPHIHNANALRLDWNKVIPAKSLSFILGNPPFIGHQWRSPDQMKDMGLIWGTKGRFGRLDYVSAWYKKALDYVEANPKIGVAFVSTNSVTQGEQATILWPALFSKGIVINFAHRTFQWTSDAKGKAAVHCVIVGFSLTPSGKKWIFDYDTVKSDPHAVQVNQINGYLADAAHIVLPSRGKAPAGLPKIIKGSQPTDGGHLILNESEKKDLLKHEPAAKKWLKPFRGGADFLNGKSRWCLWLKTIKPEELRKLPLIAKQVEKVRDFRLTSPTKSVKEFANQPTLFTQDRQPDKTFLALPETSSENRRFIPMAFLTPGIIVSNAVQMILGAGLFQLGVLSSTMHMSWVRTVTGRLESRYRYTPSTYNHFPWPDTTPKQKHAIEAAAQALLDARAKFKSSSLADLYHPISMPPAIAKAHQVLDRAVDKAYRKLKFDTERNRIEFLFRLFEEHQTPLLPPKRKQGRKKV